MIGESRFFDWLDGAFQPTARSLEEEASDALGDALTPLMARIHSAWKTPISDLTCEQVRVLASQKVGLQQLAAPIATFVNKQPCAWVTFYPGDLSTAALRAFPEILQWAPLLARDMAHTDFSGLHHELSKGDAILHQEFQRLIQGALALARGHS